ncbi:hypothetical protein LshimejAT787_0201690 [Lyophyllum shimeji]|uniref:Yeast cell wall synthesis Kre9/Knh1-like N-terminal domain-containing protein n=1 Tax=Lyophyllum shimeji TaxID=47721 RepID=A0A9P3PFQ1_LYOSH|nr:hypothetical protein LshimejAT787_0201690 [Lyophyllum shimeji]
MSASKVDPISLDKKPVSILPQGTSALSPQLLAKATVDVSLPAGLNARRTDGDRRPTYIDALAAIKANGRDSNISSFRMRFASTLALCLAPLVSAIGLSVPSNLKIGEPTTITWTHKTTDPRFTLFFMGTDAFDLRQIVGEDLDPAVGQITTTFPTDRVKPGETYYLKAVNVTWVDFVYNTSPPFTLHN